MINNQVQSSVTGKNSMMTNQAPGEAKADAGKQGGLFKLLMSSVQGGTQNGKAGAANILGGNLTLNTKQDEDGKSSALHLLAGSGEESKEEKITLTKLLDGSGASTEGAAETKGEGTESAKGDSESDDENTEGDEVAVADAKAESSDEAKSGENTQSGNLTTDGNAQTESAGEATNENSEGEASSAKSGDVNVAVAEGEGESLKNDGSVSAGEVKAGDSALAGAQQQAAVTGDAANVKQASTQKASGGDAKNSNPLSGLMGGQGGSANGKQAGGEVLTEGKILNGDGQAETRGRGEIDLNVRDGLGNVKSEGLVNELRTLAAAQGEHLAAGKQERATPEYLDGSASAEDAELVQEIFNALQSGSIEQVAAEIRSLRASQVRESKYSNYLASFANRQDMSSSGNSLSTSGGSSSSTAQDGSVSTMMPVSAMVPTGASVSSEFFDENAAVLWKEQITEYFESKDKSSAENQAAAAFARLGDVAVTNISVRRSFAQGISRAIISAAGQGNRGAEAWQKHNFTLEDGKNIQVAAREVDGVLQLKLSSSASDLNKLLMEHEKEIRELLENELELKIDLQMDGGGDGNVADFFGGSSGQQSNGKGGNNPLDLGSLRRTEEKQVEKVVPQAVRKFGYNQNEWTV